MTCLLLSYHLFSFWNPRKGPEEVICEKRVDLVDLNNTSHVYCNI